MCLLSFERKISSLLIVMVHDFTYFAFHNIVVQMLAPTPRLRKENFLRVFGSVVMVAF